ncbi:MAG: hypothetical protein ABR572_06740, partial [Cryomorphaceae bacterium]
MTGLLLFLFSCVSPYGLTGSENSEGQFIDDYYNDRVIDYTTKIFDDEIKTLLLHSSASELEPPIITLKGS